MTGRLPQRTLAALFATLLLIGCGGGDGKNTVVTPPVTVASVSVSPGSGTVEPGATLQLAARVLDGSGNAITGKTVTWTSLQPTVATVDANGVVKGVANGTATINASTDSRTGTATVVVAPPPGQRCDATQTITIGQTVSSTIDNIDCQLPDGSYAEKYVLTLTDTASVRIGMTSAAIDSYLILQNATTGAVIAENDDGNGQTHSRIERLLPAGRYVIVATTFEAGGFGVFQLAVTRATAPCLNATPLTLPASVNGTLRSTTSCVLGDSSYADRYAVTVAQTTVLTVNMRSSVFDTWLFMEDASGGLVDRDDNGSGTSDARIIASVPPGTYYIAANSAVARTSGAYTLTVEGAIDQCAADRPITAGAAITDTLSTAGCHLNDGTYARRYTLTVTTATALRLDMTSTQVDPYLIVQEAGSATTLVEDDDNGPGLNAQILRVFAPGTYVITATSATASEAGAFTLSVAGAVAGTVGVTVTPATQSLAPGQTQQLTAAVTGTTNTDVIWRSSTTGIATVSSTGLVRAIAAGSATITVQSAADPARTAQSTINVTAEGTANLDIPLVYLTQSVQTRDGRIPLVAGRATLARVFVRGSTTGLGNASVRLRFYSGATVIATLTGTATIGAVLDEGCCSADFVVPEAALVDGVTMVADVDPNNTTAESNETDNTWPLTGQSKPIRVVTVSPVTVDLVPIKHRVSGLVGPSDTRVSIEMPHMYPTGQFTPIVHAEFATDLPALSTNNSWVLMLRQMEQLRILEGSSHYFFGVLNQQAANGIVGIAAIAGTAGVGISGPDAAAQETFTHEFGHLFGRMHAPTPVACGTPANIDPDYPNPNGTTDVFGMDLVSRRIYRPEGYDVMGYCYDTWSSAYTYLGVLKFLRSGSVPTAQTLTATVTPTLLVTGSLQNGTVDIDPVFSSRGVATASRASGRYIAEGFAADGHRLFTHRFDGRAVSDVESGTQTFAVAVPYDASVNGAVAKVTVRDATGSGRTATLLRAGSWSTLPSGVNLRVDADPQLSVRSSGVGQYDISWNATRYPSVAVRNRVTGAVIAIARSGTITIRATALDALDILLSDGVSSVTQSLSTTGAP